MSTESGKTTGGAADHAGQQSDVPEEAPASESELSLSNQVADREPEGEDE